MLRIGLLPATVCHWAGRMRSRDPFARGHQIVNPKHITYKVACVRELRRPRTKGKPSKCSASHYQVLIFGQTRQGCRLRPLAGWSWDLRAPSVGDETRLSKTRSHVRNAAETCHRFRGRQHHRCYPNSKGAPKPSMTSDTAQRALTRLPSQPQSPKQSINDIVIIYGFLRQESEAGTSILSHLRYIGPRHGPANAISRLDRGFHLAS